MNTPSPGSARRSLLVFGLALAVRLAVAAPGLSRPEAVFSRPDTPTYVEPARALAATGRYLEAPGSARPATLRPPGFPAFVAAFLAAGTGLGAVAAALCVAGALTALLVYRAGLLVASEPAAFTAGLLFAFNITAIAHSPLLLSDTLFTLGAAAELLLALRILARGRLADVAAAALVAAAGAYIRPVGLPWGGAVVLLALVRPSRTARRRTAGILLAAVLFAAPLLPWMARNASVGAGFQLHTNLGHTVLDHMAAAVLAEDTGRPEETVREDLRAGVRREFAAHPDRYRTPGARNAYRVRRGRRILAEHPLTTLRLTVSPVVLLPDAPTLFEDLGVTATGRGTLAVIHERGLLAGVRHYFGGRAWILLLLLPALALAGLTYLGATVELAAWIVRRRWRLLVLFLLFVPYYLLVPGPQAVPRFQIPALPLLCVMAASAIFRTARRRNGQRIPFSSSTSS